MLERAKATSEPRRRGSKSRVRVRVVEEGRIRVRPDTLATEEPYALDSGMRKTLQAYTAPRATCITTPAAAINHRLVTF